MLLYHFDSIIILFALVRKTSQCVSFFRKEKVMIWNLKVSKYGFIKHLSWYTNVTEHFHTLFSLSLFTYQLFILAFISDEICIKNKKHVQNEISFQLKKMYALFFKNTKPFKASRIPNVTTCQNAYYVIEKLWHNTWHD